MTNPVTTLPVKTDKDETKTLASRQPFEAMRREIDRLFDGFLPARWPLQGMNLDIEPFANREFAWAKLPAVDVAEKESEYEVTAELPGIDEKQIEVAIANNLLTVKGEKQEEKEDKKKDYHLTERHYGSFQRTFRLPEGVDTENVAATFKNGVLKVTLPKTAEAQKRQKIIPVKAA